MWRGNPHCNYSAVVIFDHKMKEEEWRARRFIHGRGQTGPWRHPWSQGCQKQRLPPREWGFPWWWDKNQTHHGHADTLEWDCSDVTSGWAGLTTLWAGSWTQSQAEDWCWSKCVWKIGFWLYLFRPLVEQVTVVGHCPTHGSLVIVYLNTKLFKSVQGLQ